MTIRRYQMSIPMALLLGGAGLLVVLGFVHAVRFMVGQWQMDEFSHGYIIPFVSAYLIWQRRYALQQIQFRGSWLAVLLLVGGITLDVMGRLAALWPVQHLALLVVIAALVWSLVGNAGMRLLAVPLGVLIFMIPLPNILLQSLSATLQLVSSSIGVALMRAMGVVVFLEGNVIDLGNFKLEVAQACSGLRYLLPLMTLGFLVAGFYRASWWKRAVVFLSSIPITVLINSLRIAAIGIMVQHWGIGMAEGFLHEVQGWMMFMLCTAILLLEVWVLSRVTGDRRPLRELFSIDSDEPPPAGSPSVSQVIPPSLYAAGTLLAVFALTAFIMPSPKPQVPARETFVSFPMQLGAWSGRAQGMESEYLDTLKLDDYLLANYTSPKELPVNLYIAWYDQQSAGESTHSPKACLPGGGWQIKDLRQVQVGNLQVWGQPLRVNRVLIQYEDQRQLVYYWFMQRGRLVTNEYLVKWYLMVDSITRHRGDGALVRLIVPLSPGMSPEQADQQLQAFASAMVPKLGPFIPN